MHRWRVEFSSYLLISCHEWELPDGEIGVPADTDRVHREDVRRTGVVVDVVDAKQVVRRPDAFAAFVVDVVAVVGRLPDEDAVVDDDDDWSRVGRIQMLDVAIAWVWISVMDPRIDASLD